MNAPSWWRRYDRTPVKDLGRSNPTRFGVIVIVILLIAAYFGFTKHIPFKHGFRLKAVFSTAVNVRKSSPVRIAGVDVGKVSHIAREGNAGLVTMEIESSGLPIHSDATVKIRPRTFLEGNWFVELQPGSPSAKVLSSGATLPITQTSDPVQLDQVLDALNTDTRANLQNFLIGYGDGLTRKPDAAENAEQDPELYGLNGAQALNKAYQRGPSSLRATAVLNQAITGTVPNDLSALVASIGKVTSALNVHEQQLGELIVNFNAFFRSFADQSASLRATVAELPSSLSAIDRGFPALGAALPPARTFALDILPGVKATPATVTATLPWIEQVQASLAPNELGGVAEGLAEAAPWLAQAAERTGPLPAADRSCSASARRTSSSRPATRSCRTERARPASKTTRSSGTALVGLNSIGQNFDGNGDDGALPAVEQRPDAASPRRHRSSARTSRAAAARPRVAAAARHAPGLPGQRAAVQADRALLHPGAAQLQRSAVAGPGRRERRMNPTDSHSHEGGLSVRDQIERYRSAFVAVVTMVVIAAVVGGYILAHENLNLPGWVPVLGKNYYTLKADLQTAQALTPGQGQAVTIAGAKVGEIASVDLHEGVAVVTMHMTPKYAHLYRDATLLMRPKTNLQDMTVEVDPGTPATGRLPSGSTLPISQTAPNIDFDQFLAGLDAETRAVSAGAARGRGRRIEEQRQGAVGHAQALLSDRPRHRGDRPAARNPPCQRRALDPQLPSA